MMKKAIQTTLSAILALALVGIVQAQPTGKGKGYRIGKASTVKQIESLKKGEQYAVVCTVCKTVTIKTVGKAEEAATLCHDGGKVHCASCDSDRTIKRVGPPGKQHPIYVNKHGKECMFVAILKKK